MQLSKNFKQTLLIILLIIIAGFAIESIATYYPKSFHLMDAQADTVDPSKLTNVVPYTNNFSVPKNANLPYTYVHPSLGPQWQGEAHAQSIGPDEKGNIDEWMPDQYFQVFLYDTNPDMQSEFNSFKDFKANLTKNDMKSVTILDASQDVQYQNDVNHPTDIYKAMMSMHSLEGLQYATDLDTIEIWPNDDVSQAVTGNIAQTGNLWDISALANLKDLESVHIEFMPVSDISPLANKPDLDDVDFMYDSITDLSPLATDSNLNPMNVQARYQKVLENPITLNKPAESANPYYPTFNYQHTYSVKEMNGQPIDVSPYTNDSVNTEPGGYADGFPSTATGGNYGTESVDWTQFLPDTASNYGLLTTSWFDINKLFSGWILQPYQFAAQSEQTSKVNISFQQVVLGKDLKLAVNTLASPTTLTGNVGDTYDIVNSKLPDGSLTPAATTLNNLTSILGDPTVVLGGTGSVSDFLQNNGKAPSEHLSGTFSKDPTTANIVWLPTDVVKQIVQFIDTSDNNKVVGTATVSAFSDKENTYNVDTSQFPKGLKLADGQEAAVKFTGSATPLKIKVAHETTLEDVSTNYTVKYAGLPDNLSISDSVQPIKWTKQTDEVNGNVSYVPASQPEPITTPNVPGYSADQSSVDFGKLDTQSTAPSDVTKTVLYTKETSAKPTSENFDTKLTVKYAGLPAGSSIADNTQTIHWNKVTNPDTGAVSYTPTNQPQDIQTPAVKGYTADKASALFGKLSTQTSEPTDQAVTVQFTQNQPASSTSQLTTTLTVKYVGLPDSSAIKDNVQTIKWLKNIDNTTGEVKYIPLDKDKTVFSPIIDGYTPDRTSIDFGPIVTIITEPKDRVETVTYTKKPVKPATVSELTTTLTIKYQGLPANQAVKDNVQTIHWIKNTDKTTGQTTYIPLDQDAIVSSPLVNGYSPDRNKVDFGPIVMIITEPQNRTEIVNYQPNNSQPSVSATNANAESLPSPIVNQSSPKADSPSAPSSNNATTSSASNPANANQSSQNSFAEFIQQIIQKIISWF